MMQYGLWALISITIGSIYITLNLNPDITTPLVKKAIWVILLGNISILAIMLIKHFAFPFLTNNKGEKTDLIEFVINVFLYSCAIALILKFGIGYNISGFLATSALITAILGLAMQATLSNIFSGVSLHIEHPFNIGDYIRIPHRDVKSQGVIEAIRWRSIVVRRTDNSRVIVPNNEIALNMIEVFSKNKLNRSTFYFSVSDSILPQKIKRLVVDTLMDIAGIVTEKGIKVSMREKDEEFHTIQYSIKFYPEKQSVDNRIKATINERLWYTFHRNNIFTKNMDAIESQFPTSTLKSILETHLLFNQFGRKLSEKFIKSGRKLLFSSGEKITFPYYQHSVVFIIIKGNIKHIIKNCGQVINDDMIDEFEKDVCFHDFNKLKLEDTEALIVKNMVKKLTMYIGPFAELISYHVVRKYSDPYYWYQILSCYISDLDNKSDFLQDSPENPSIFYQSGEIIGLSDFLLNNEKNTDNIYAQGELAIFELDHQLLSDWLVEKPENKIFLQEIFKHS